MTELIAGLLAIWFLCLGLAIMVRQHRRFLHWSWRQAQRPFRWAWARWRTEIMSFFFGVGLAKIVQWNAVFWPVAIAAGIILAVWLLGLAITHFAITPNGARVYIDRSREVIADATGYLWNNLRTQIIWFSIGMIASIFVKAR